jgi:outer membrane protein assembly factor BamB
MFNRKNATKRIIELLIAGLFTIATIWMIAVAAVQFVNPPPTPTPTPQIVLPPREVLESSLPLQEAWRWSGISFPWITPNLVVVDNHIITAALDYGIGIKLIAFDAQTGNSVWESEYIQELTAGSNSFDSIDADNERVYVGTLRNVQAFDLKTGQLLWVGAKQPREKHGILNVYFQKNQVEAYSYPDEILYILDPTTGETLNKMEVPGILIKYDDVAYGEYRSNRVWAKSLIGQQQLLWEQELGRARIQLWPLFVDDMMYVLSGSDSGIGDRQIFALSTKTGEIIWQSPPKIASNIAFSRGRLFAIQADATIVALDAKTGQQMGQLTVKPAVTYQNSVNQNQLGYTIGASEEVIAVYYRDSQELIIFRWE